MPEMNGKIERRNHGGGSSRMMPHHGRMGSLIDQRIAQIPLAVGKSEIEFGDHRRHFESGFAQRFAGLAGNQHRKLLRAITQGLAADFERRAPRIERQRGPSGEGRPGFFNRGIQVARMNLGKNKR